MSALPPKADIGTQSWNVRFVRRQKQTFVASLNDGRSGSVVVSDTQR
jgi:hypothetical protein